MESMNKFKILTIVVICLFLFAIGAIYSNTKDVAIDKQKEKVQEVKEDMQTDIQDENTQIKDSSQTVQDLSNQISLLNSRVDELNEKIGNSSSDTQTSSSSSNLDCKIIGSMTDRGIEQLSPDAAVQEARVNNRDIVISCSLK